MTTPNFTTSIQVDQSPAEVFNAVTNVRGWWSEEIKGNTSKLDDVFDYHYEDVHRCKVKLIEVIPNQKVVWHILENYFKFTEDETEWTNTTIVFEITKVGDKTQLQMTHVGLVPEYECFEICKNSWTNYIQKSMRSLIETGKGMPNATGKPQTENERKLSEK
ncbi:MAG: SRPBCC domain-containing protein [Bacteroidota bacterium]